MNHLTQNVVNERAGKRGRNRRWPESRKREIVAETYEPGLSVSIVARRHDVNANQVFRWRRQYRSGGSGKVAPPEFIPLGMVGPSPASTRTTGMMTIDLGNGILVRVDRDVDESALERVLAALKGSP